MAEYRFDDLVTKMAGRDTLNGWDVLISYRDSLVLEEIKKQNSFSTLLDPLTWTDQLTDMFGNCSSIQMSLQLQPPSISLANGEAKINLTFPIQECSWRIVDSTPSSPQTQQLPPGLSVVLSTPLGAISGDFAIGVRGNKFSVDLGATSFVNANTVQILEHHEPTQYWAFCLDFDHVFADIAPSQQILQPINRIICRKVAELFEARNVRFYMGSLSQIMTEEPSIMNGMFLHPNRFCFTVSGSALCIWIEVSGMENSSLEPSTRRKLEFKPDGSVINPIPVGSDASIVFSHALMHTFLKRGVGLPGLCVDLQDVSSQGISTNMILEQRHIKMPKYHNEYRGIAGSHSENVEEWTVDLETLPPILNIETNNKVSITYKNEIKIRWSWSKDVGMIYGHGKDSFPAIFDMKGTGTWHPSSNTARPNQIVLKLSVDPNWCTIKGKRLGNSGYPNFFIDHVKPPPVPFTNAEMILDYMDVTNMLFPSKHCFVANDVGSSNFAFPRDAILVGKFRQVTPALKLPAAASEPGANSKGIKDFVNSLLSEPITPLYGDLINAMVSQSDDVGNRVNAILKQYGYPEYSAEEILSPLRLSPEILFSPKRSLGGGLGGTSLLTDHSSSPGAATEEGSNSPMSSKGVNEERFQSYHGLLSTLIEPIDIRLFGGRYTITEPLSDAGAILIIHPGTGKIYHEGIISLPKVTLNKETSDTLVAWSRNGRQFVATFNVSIDETTNLGTVSVHGRMTDVQDEPTAFSAQLDSSRVSNTMRSKRTHSAGMLRSAEAGSDDTLQPEESIEEWAQSDQLGLAIALGVALTTLLFLGAIISKARGSQRGRDVAAAHDALLRQGVAEFKEHLTTKAKEKARNDLIAHEWEVNQLVEQVTGGMRDCVRLLTRFQPYREWVLSHDIDARVEPDSPGGAMLRQVREEMESVLTQRLGPLLEGMLEARSAEYGVSHMLPPEEWRRIKGDVVADLVRNATEALKSDDTDHPSFFEAMTFSLVLDLRAQIYEDHLRDDTTGIERCQARIQNLNSAENTIRTRLANLHEGDNVETLQEELAHMMNEREIEKFHLETFEELRERHEENRNQMESQRREAQKRAEEVKNRAKESFRGK